MKEEICIGCGDSFPAHTGALIEKRAGDEVVLICEGCLEHYE